MIIEKWKKSRMEHGKYSYDYKHLQIDQVLVWNNPLQVDILLNKLTNSSCKSR